MTANFIANTNQRPGARNHHEPRADAPLGRSTFLSKRAEHLGEVEAPDERSAIKKAAEEFHIPPDGRNGSASASSATRTGRRT
jgi:hypothetical protein